MVFNGGFSIGKRQELCRVDSMNAVRTEERGRNYVGWTA